MNLETAPEIVEEAVREIGIGFLFAPLYHSAMRFAAKPRKEIGLRSIFNMLGPLTNPAGADCQLLGVYAPELTEMFANALQLLGTKRAFVVHGHDGLDEISVCAPTRVSELNDGMIRTYDIHPEQYFGELADPETLKGRDPEKNASITRAILGGRIHQHFVTRLHAVQGVGPYPGGVGNVHLDAGTRGLVDPAGQLGGGLVTV